MANVTPFKGVRYNTDKIPDIARLVCPPYDVISKEAQEQYYQQHEYNMVRVELGKDLPEDTMSYNRYARASTYLTRWLNQGILIRDPSPALYFYTMSYRHPQEGTKSLKGFLATVQLEEPEAGQILPHEWTFPSAKQDRLQLLHACGANTSPIFTLYSDPENQVAGQIEKAVGGTQPINSFVSEDGIHHRLWIVSDTAVQQGVTERLRRQPLYIADGHHRYETALNYRHEIRARARDQSAQPYDYVLMYCASMNDPGMSLLPIHRLILNPLPLKLDEIRKRLAKYFDIIPLLFTETKDAQVRAELFERMKTLGTTQTIFGMYTQEGGTYDLLRFKNQVLGEAPVKRLDVMVFQQYVLEQVLGIEDTAAKKEAHLRFMKDAGSAVEAVRNKTAGIAFFLNPTRVNQVRDVVLSGDRMPQKSTYFYPKPLTGLVLNVF